ncbi:hypothetical protein BGZ93_002271 [Podila epicladia]|nr:hypothetical protein BGZ93_002271 [Podila epicladia]
MEKAPYSRQRKQGSGLIDGNITSLANLTIPESILKDTPYPDIESLDPAQKLTPEQVEKQRAIGALKGHEQLGKARDGLKSASKTEQGSILLSSSSRQMDKDNSLHIQSITIGPQQQVPRYHPSQEMSAYSARLSHVRPHCIPKATATTSTIPSFHPRAPWQQHQSNIGSGDPLPPGMSSLPQSLLVPNTRPMAQPGRPGVAWTWRPQQYNAASPTTQLPANTLPDMSRQVGNDIHDRVQQNMHTSHLPGAAEQAAGGKRGAEDARMDAPGTDKPRRMKKRGASWTPK